MAIEIKDRITANIPKRLKRRLKTVADDKNLSVNDILVEAINDYLDRLDGEYHSTDIMTDRLSQILRTQMVMNQELQNIYTKVREIDERL